MRARIGTSTTLPVVTEHDPAIRKQLRREAANGIRQWRKLKLANSAIRRLFIAVDEELMAIRMLDSWPTAGHDKQALEGLMQSLMHLSTVLHSLSPRARLEFNMVERDALGDFEVLRASVLAQLALRLRTRIDRLPAQDRRQSYTGLVARLASIVEPLGLRPSASEKSRFFQACQAAFLVGSVRSRVSKTGSRKNQRSSAPSPAASIRQYLSSRATRGDSSCSPLQSQESP